MKEPQLRELLAELDVEVRNRTHDSWLRCPCPFAEFKHDSGKDSDPSFFAKIESNGLSGFHCFTCKEHGRMSSLVRKLEHYRNEDYGNLAIRADLLETPDSFDEYDAPMDIDIDPDPLNKAAYLSMYPLAWENDKSRAYLLGRAIGEETSYTLQLQFDDEELRILFPVFDFRGELYGFSGRSILSRDEIKRLNSSGKLRVEYPSHRDYAGLPKEKLLLGEHLIDKEKRQWVIEGLFAYAHFVEIGARDLVNPLATLGSQMSVYQRDLLVDYNRLVYLGYDNDAAGEVGIYGIERDERRPGALKLLQGHVPVIVPLYPEGKNDPDELSFYDVEEMITYHEAEISLDY